MEGGAPKGRRLDGDSGISDTKPSPQGEGAPKGRIGQERYEKERGRSSQVGDIDERGSVSNRQFTKAPYPPLARSPFPDGEGKEEAASPQVKKANPASLRSAAPSKGRGSRGHSLLPMEGGAPKGRRLDGDSGISDTKPSPQGEGAPKGRIGQERYEKERGRSSQVGDIDERGSVSNRQFTKAPYPPLARSPFPDGEGKEEAASPQVKKANPASLRSAAPSKGRGSRGHSLLPMEGGAPKGRRLDGDSGISDTKPSPQGEGAPKGRIGQERYEKERGRSSQVRH